MSGPKTWFGGRSLSYQQRMKMLHDYLYKEPERQHDAVYAIALRMSKGESTTLSGEESMLIGRMVMIVLPFVSIGFDPH